MNKHGHCYVKLYMYTPDGSACINDLLVAKSFAVNVALASPDSGGCRERRLRRRKLPGVESSLIFFYDRRFGVGPSVCPPNLSSYDAVKFRAALLSLFFCTCFAVVYLCVNVMWALFINSIITYG